ncbi:MAG: MFS transporter [Thermomicrobiales bacterium]
MSGGTVRPPSGRDAGFGALLSDPNLRRLWFTQLFSSSGESLAQIAMPLLVYELTGSARMVGLMALVLILPRVVLAPITGLLADRLDRRRLMIGSDVLRLVLAGLVPLTTNLWQLAILAVAISVGNAVGRGPAELAAVPSVAGPHRLVAALSLVQVSNGIIRIAIPAAGAGAIAAVGPGPVFWIQAGCFAGSLLALRRLHIPHEGSVSGEQPGLLQSARREMWLGLRMIRTIPIVRGVHVGSDFPDRHLRDDGRRTDLYPRNAGPGRCRIRLVRAHDDLSCRRGGPRRRRGTPHRTAHRSPIDDGARVSRPFFLAIAVFQPGMPVIYAAWFVFGFLDALAVISFQAYLAEAVVPASERGRTCRVGSGGIPCGRDRVLRNGMDYPVARRAGDLRAGRNHGGNRRAAESLVHRSAPLRPNRVPGGGITQAVRARTERPAACRIIGRRIRRRR